MKVKETRLEIITKAGNRYDGFDAIIKGDELCVMSIPAYAIETLMLEGLFDPGPSREIQPNFMSAEKMRTVMSLVEVRFSGESKGRSTATKIVPGVTVGVYLKNSPQKRSLYSERISAINVVVALAAPSRKKAGKKTTPS